MPNDRHRRPTLATYSGLEFYPLDPKSDQITLADIAHGLAFTCRYAGQVPKFYSVAEHSIHVCVLLEKRFPEEKNLHKWGLMHDASEAYLGDLPRPLKDLDASYQATEAKVMGVIAKMFKLSPVQYPKEVHTADIDVFLRERQVFFEKGYDWWHTDMPPDDAEEIDILALSPEQAEADFLDVFRRVFGVNE